MIPRITRQSLLPVILLATTGRVLPAQSQPTPPRKSHEVRLLQKKDAVVALGVAGLTIAAMSLDERFAANLQRPSVQTNRTLSGAANVFNNIGFPGAPIISAGLYFAGLSRHSGPLAALGMHTGEAIVLGGVLSEAFAMAIGRARPLHDLRSSRDFQFGKGFSNDDYTSMPSAHVTVAFAAATAISEETGRSWPSAERYVVPLSYSLAGLVGAARMYKNKHWASDVVAAAGLGTYSAVLFDRYNRSRPDNIFNRVFLPASVALSRQGARIDWSIALK